MVEKLTSSLSERAATLRNSENTGRLRTNPSA